MTRTLSKSEVCILVPAYNEEKRIGAVIEAVRQRGFPVLAVDDGSFDNTFSVIQKSGAQGIRSPKNEGKGAAMRRGFEWILNSPHQAVIIVDADGQHDPAELERFLEALSEADVVVGDRMRHPAGMSLLRRLTNRVMSFMISSVAGQKIPDTQCGYRALSRRALQTMHLRTERYEIESEILMEAGRRGLKILSIPIRSVYRDEISRIRPMRDTGRFFRFLFEFILSRR